MGDHGDAMLRNQNASFQARTKAHNRADLIQLKLIGQSHPTGLTANLLKLFEPRPPLEFKTPPEKRKCLPYTGMAQFVSKFAEHGDPEYAPLVKKGETPAERRARIRQIRLEEGSKKAAKELEKYDPNNDRNVSGDPYKTLFVARLNYETTESRVKREFEAYGPIKQVRLVTDKETNKPRGYAFVEYMHKRDMKAAYKQADGKKIDNRRVLVDVERGRTVPNWRPRRLGGGLGTTRIGSEDSSTNPRRDQVLPGGISRSEEPRVERDREKSRERGRDRDRDRGGERVRVREKSRELSHDREKDRDRHHKGRERTRDKDRDKDRDRARDRDRGGRDIDRSRDRDRGGRKRERDQDHEPGDQDLDRGYDFDRVDSKRSRGERGEDGGGGFPETERGRGGHHLEYYESHVHDRYKEYDRDRLDDQIDDDEYSYERRALEAQEREYRRSDRSVSREY